MDVELIPTAETLRFGGREFEVVFDDDGIDRAAVAFDELVYAMPGAEDGEKLAQAMQAFVTAVAGEECWQAAVSTVDSSGAGAGKCTSALVPLVTALEQMCARHVIPVRQEHVKRYLGTAEAV